MYTAAKSKEIKLSTQCRFTVGSDNRLQTWNQPGVGTWTYSYDNEGNLIQKTLAGGDTWTYGYDDANHLVSVQDRTSTSMLVMQGTYVYDAFGQRISKVVWQINTTTTTTNFAWVGDHIWADLDSSGTLQTRRLYLDGVDQLFARVNSSGTAAWYMIDRENSTRDILNSAGTMVLDHIDYDAFGNVTTETNSSNGDRYKYTGRELDPETGQLLGQSTSDRE